MKKPVRIEITWERMLEIMSQTELVDEISDISSEEDLNKFMGWGRNCFSCGKVFLTDEEILRLESAGFIHGEDYEDILLIVQKETYPGKYMIGEF